jgi:hypothetical protein
MKWAKTLKELKKLSATVSPSDLKANFSIYDSLSIDDPTAPPQKTVSSNKVSSEAFGLRKTGIKGKGVPTKTVFKLWTVHKNLPNMSEKIRRKYEVFCGGFLYFYDNELLAHKNGKETGKGYLHDLKNDHQMPVEPVMDYFRDKLNNGLLDHEMWFNWGPDPTKKGRWMVTIYLNPPPGNPDPPSTPPPPPPEDSFA